MSTDADDTTTTTMTSTEDTGTHDDTTTGTDTGTEGGDATTSTDGGNDDGTGSPVEYGDFTVPDGITLDQEALDTFLPLAKELNLPKEQAQRFVDLGSSMVAKVLTGITEKHQATVEGWAKQAGDDAEIGEDFAKGKESAALRAFNTFATPELKQTLEETGLGNHPEMIRLFYRLSQKMREDTFHIPKGAEGGPLTLEDKLARLYDKK